MKKLFSLALLLCCTLFGCKEQKSEKKEGEKVENAPKEWLTFEGKEDHAKHIVLVSG